MEISTVLPKDPVILVSFINTQLRDNYATLDEFCKVFQVEKDEIVETLKDFSYEYKPEYNRFI
ncbi:MAG: DUF4250 domain-containing protein [Lachnospiraceae bacterium]|jgi:hypothetical protein|nr:DUF4250 domain-containing protein [Lachnospiraceae bacterium]